MTYIKTVIILKMLLKEQNQFLYLQQSYQR